MKKLIFALALACCTTAAYAADTVPFKAAIHTNIEVITTDPSCLPPLCLSVIITGIGQGSHFGRMTLAGPSRIVNDPATGEVAQTGTSTLTAADGSTMGIVFEGTGSIPDASGLVHFQGEWTVVPHEGTGRFQGASGEGTYEGSATIPIGVVFFNGRLSNPGKNKK